MKKLINLFTVIMAIFILSACNSYVDTVIPDPANPRHSVTIDASRYEPQFYVEVRPNEVAYLIKLEGNTKDKQSNIKANSFTEEQKVLSKRIRIPFQRKLAMEGIVTNTYKWMPAYTIIKLDCAMKTVEWTQNTESGSTANDDAIRMESAESIEFYQNFIVSAKINQDMTAAYLNEFGMVPLTKVLNSNVKGDVKTILTGLSSRNKLKDLRGLKNEMYDRLDSLVVSKYARVGVTIMTVGADGGFRYVDSDIQKNINEEFKSSLLESIATKKQRAALIEANTEVEKAAIFAKNKANILQKQRLEIEVKDAETRQIFAKNFKTGNVQTMVLDSKQLQMFLK